MSRDDFAYRDTGSGAPGAYGHRGRRNGLGIAALVLGLLAVLLSITLFGGLVLGVAAVVCGILGRRRARRGEASNGGMALAGLVLGGIGIVVPLALIAVGTSVLNSDEGRRYSECVTRAGDDQVALRACAEQFGRSLTG